MKIFLDFDGVLRRESSPRSALDPDCVRHFEEAVLSHPDARVVISSTWRLAYRLDGLKKLFSNEAAARIEGVTPVIDDVEDYQRHIEIQAYMNRDASRGIRWVAVDDDPDNFKPGAALILVDPAHGFDATCAVRLREWLAGT